MVRRFVAAAALALLVQADSLTQDERDFASRNLLESRKLFLDTVAALSEKQWNYKPSADRWSVAEIAEHLALSEDLLFNVAQESLKKSGPAPRAKLPTDDAVMAFMRDRSIKAQAPNELQPRHDLDKSELIARFLKSRDRTIEYIRTTKDDLRTHYTDGPLGPMVAYQTLIGISGHCEKHVGQMRDVMASPGFPRK